MTPLELKGFLQTANLSQADFARLMGVTPRAVMLWLSGTRAIPGPAEAYTRLFSLAPQSARQIELQRLKESATEMRDGMYAVQYESLSKAGLLIGGGTLILDNGKAYGADPVGATFDGDYIYDLERGAAQVRLKLTFPPGLQTVFGMSNPFEWSIDIVADLDPRLDVGTTQFKTPFGHVVNVQYKYMRGLIAA